MAIHEEQGWLTKPMVDGSMMRVQMISVEHAQGTGKEVSSAKSRILDAAYDEYCRRLKRDCEVEIDSFIAEYPGLESSLRRQIEVHHVLISHLRHPTFAARESWPALGEEFLDFKILEQIGVGGLARVYLCQQTTVGDRHVVLKVASNTSFEASVLGRVEHPHIVPIHSIHFDVATGLSGICMPFLGRSTFVDVIDAAFQSGNLPTSSQPIIEALTKNNPAAQAEPAANHRFAQLLGRHYEPVILGMMANLANALQYAHERGIVHGDLKPSNILLTTDGRPRLLDFNLSGDRLHCEAILGGTLPYMAPEQIKAFFLSGSLDHLTEQTDVFSFGVVLYELLSGKRPFESDVNFASHDYVEGILCSISAGAVPLTQIHPQLDPMLDQLVQACLAVEPADRPASMKEVSQRLQALVTKRHRLGRAFARYRSRLLAALAVLLLCLAGFLYYLFQLEPYAVRQYQRAWQYYREGNAGAAAPHVDNAIRDSPEFGEALYLRGRLKLQQKEYQDAMLDFDRAAKLQGDGRSIACIGYCLQRLHDPLRAKFWYEKALARGYESAELLNNLGVLQTASGKTDAAAECFSRAISKDSSLPICYMNQAIVELHRAQRDGAYVPQRGIESIKHYLKQDPQSAEAQGIAAYLLGYAAQHNPGLIPEVRKHLLAARKYGWVITAEEQRRDPAFKGILKIAHAEGATPSVDVKSTRPPRADHLLDPVPDR